ncbi:hypothetical protein ACFQX6_19710 [Streptosporangium lutulentum]
MLTLEEARATALVPVNVPASGLASFRVEPSDQAAVRPTTFAPATATARALSNGLVEVAIAADGTLDVTGTDGTVLHGVGRLVDGGDRGDSYNYAPPAQDVLVSEPRRSPSRSSRTARCVRGRGSPASTNGLPLSPPNATCATAGPCRPRWRPSWRCARVSRSSASPRRS